MIDENLMTIFYSCQTIMGNKWLRISRKRDYVYKRCIFFKICREYSSASLTKIGGLIKKDHATVLHGLKRFDNDIRDGYGIDYKAYQELYERCCVDVEQRIKELESKAWTYNQRLVQENVNLRGDNEKLKKALKVMLA